MKTTLLVAALALATIASASAQNSKADRKAAKAAVQAAKEAPAAPAAAAAPAPAAAPMAASVEAPKIAYPPQERAERKSRQIAKAEGLTPEQASKLVPILFEQFTAVDALKAKVAAEGKSKETSQAIRDANQRGDDLLKTVLTPDQFASMMKKREEKAAESRAKREAAMSQK